jgi:glycerol-3-phosphate cytidylyltransferase
MPAGTTGYLFGIFDLFHIAHLDLIRSAAASCDRLIVAIAGDDLVEQTCGVRPFVPAIERIEIVGAIEVIAEVRPLNSLDLRTEAQRVGADVIFVPSDELDAVQLAALNNRATPPTWSGLDLVRLAGGRRTTSPQVREALAGTTTRSSVA